MAACAEDPSKLVGETWQCDDPRCTCTCPSGQVEASCPQESGAPLAPTSVTMEEMLVKGAFAAVLALMCCFAVMCCFMFRKNKEARTRAQVLQEVDDMELEDRD
eukprot:CAMPEP_0115832624 /NCGR_PEP_ID=MMETSP0287-20121206/2755_1 /TAXON_ID=412157 /ORGANISM="Chrysochromulina rotalis, Strain UIO044" /LENGTH=103 /DNA_ID=CAMNT_0003286017 /DNA_START=12 /DNA_END=323 /DNA_ORIENTATION=-